MMSEPELERLLACPRCRSALQAEDGRYRCECGYTGRRIERWPVLVDFETSILDEDDVARRAGASAVTRSRAARLRKGVARLRRLRNRTEGSRLDSFVDLLPPSPIVVIAGGGADQHGLAPLYADPDIRLVAFDIYGSDLVQLIADGHSIPLASGSVDAVVIQAVLEHVLDPPLVVAEIHRILRPEGIVYAETAFMQQVHEGAYDFTRYTESGHRWLFRDFEQLDAGALTGPVTQLVWTADYLVRSVTRSQLAGRVLHKALSPLTRLDRLIPAKYSVDSSPAVFFLGRRSDTRLEPHDMVAYYKGAQ